MTTMLNEILSAPTAVKNAVGFSEGVILKIAAEFKKRGLSNITTVARGSSNNAATYFKYVSEIVANIPVSKYLPSVTTVYGECPGFKHNMLLAISQSGQSTDTMLVLQAAKERGALTVAMTNDEKSPLALAADYHIFLAAGKECSVSATKSFLSQLTALYLLANALSSHPARMNVRTLSAHLGGFIDEKRDAVAECAGKCGNINNIIVLSRGLMQGIADETALKLIETSYLFSRPFSTTDFMHGPLAIVTEGTNIILLAPSGAMEAEFIDIARRLSLLGANLIAVSDIEEIQRIADNFIAMPHLGSMEQPFYYAVTMQLFSEKLAEAKGINPDTPRNLKKVTITK